MVIDELGRGTSTRDGVAVACAVLEHLVRRVGCLTYMVTHYPQARWLAGRAASPPACVPLQARRDNTLNALVCAFFSQVAALESSLAGAMGCYYMAYCVEGEGEADGEQGGAGGGVAAVGAPPRVTFLYRLTRGVAQASFGLNVARMAGLPEGVVRRAADRAAAFQEEDAGEGERALEAVARAARAGLEAAAAEGGGAAEGEVRRVQAEVAQALRAG